MVTILEGDRVFKDCRVMPASLVSGNAYRRLWRRQLAEYIDASPHDLLWPPPSRHAE